MKKYCLTSCAKKKFSKWWEVTLISSSILFILAGATGAFALVSAGIGYAMIEWTDLIKDGSTYIEAGSSTILLSFVFGLVIYYITREAFRISKKITKSIKDRYEGNHTYCKLFEECKEGNR